MASVVMPCPADFLSILLFGVLCRSMPLLYVQSTWLSLYVLYLIACYSGLTDC